MAKILIFVCLLTSSLSYGTQSPKTCEGSLALLDMTVVHVLNEIADLLVQNQNTDGASAISVTVREILDSKMAALDLFFTDSGMQELARQYLKDKIAELTQSDIHASIRIKEVTEKARREERLQFGKYKVLETSFALPHPNTDVTSSGDILYLETDLRKSPPSYRLSFENIFDDSVRTLHLSESINAAWSVKYNPQDGQAFIITADKVYSVEIPKTFDENTIAQVKTLIDVDSHQGTTEIRSKLESAFAVLKDKFDFKDEEIKTVVHKLRPSQDGKILVGTLGSYIIVFNIAAQSFRAIRTIGFGKNGIKPYDWSLSPDGQSVALGSDARYTSTQLPVGIYQTATGRRPETWDSKTTAVGFSNDGQWIALNKGKDHLVLENRFQGLPAIELQRPPFLPKGVNTFYDRFIFSPDDTRVFAIEKDTIDIWKTDGTFQQRIKHPKDHFTKIQFVDNDEYLILFTADWRVEVAVMAHEAQTAESSTKPLKQNKK